MDVGDWTALLGTTAGVAVALAAILWATQRGRPAALPVAFLGVVILGVAFLVAVSGGRFASTDAGPSTNSSPTASTTPHPHPGTAVPPTPSATLPSASSAQPSSAVTTAPTITYLDSVEPIEKAFMRESVGWGAETFPHSLVDPLSGCSFVGPVDWVIPPGMRTFKSEIGVATDAVEPESRVSFTVYLDNVPAAPTRTLAVGQHEPVEVALGAASRLRLEAVIDESRRNTCSADAEAVWGDPRLES